MRSTPEPFGTMDLPPAVCSTCGLPLLLFRVGDRRIILHYDPLDNTCKSPNWKGMSTVWDGQKLHQQLDRLKTMEVEDF